MIRRWMESERYRQAVIIICFSIAIVIVIAAIVIGLAAAGVIQPTSSGSG